ncbi:MAG: adenylyltransferase/cytidyltransferase family protein [Bacteroidota bacterium]|jgi:pantetheine-phosphate adenylyltransferase|nr:adenylyltransferase/cytidyltransferase family protein [Bacteroidota bacterium]
MIVFSSIDPKLSFAELLEVERREFATHQEIDFREYKKQRLAFLDTQKNPNAKTLYDFVKSNQPKIGVFAGSFNPFHKGHYNVLKKAEKLFDKVIIAFGKNPEKNDRSWPVPKTIANRQLTEYHGLLTDHIESFGYDVTVIRGLRNSTDFQYEQNQYRYIQELKPDIRIINIFCDKEFEHISSSGIRTLEKYNKHQSYLLD